MNLIAMVLAQTPPPEQTLDWLTRGGMIGILATIVIGAVLEWWVPGRTHRRVISEFNQRLKEAQDSESQWKRYALRMLDTTDKAVTLADKDVFP